MQFHLFLVRINQTLIWFNRGKRRFLKSILVIVETMFHVIMQFCHINETRALYVLQRLSIFVMLLDGTFILHGSYIVGVKEQQKENQ